MDRHERRSARKSRRRKRREGRTISDGLYLNYLGSIHTWDKHCHPKGLSRRHLTGTLYSAGVPQEWKKLEELREGGERNLY